MKKLLIITAVAAVALVMASVVFAGSISFAGTLTAGGPTEPQVAQIVTPNCTGSYVVFPVLYRSYGFTVDVSGAYTFTEPGVESAVYVYAGSFNPALPADNCIAASNSNPINLPVALTAGTTYYVVVIEDTFDQDGMAYNIGISGPGSITPLTPPAGACPYPLPSGSVIRNVPLGAPTYYAADAGTRTTFDLPAGNWYVARTSGDFAQVWIACQANLVWIPVTALGG